MFALLVPSDNTHFIQQSLKQTAQVGRKTAKTDLGQLSRQLLQLPVGSNTDVGETQTRCESVAALNWLNQY